MAHNVNKRLTGAGILLLVYSYVFSFSVVFLRLDRMCFYLIQMCVFSLFNAYLKILIFTELIVLIVLQVWASVAVMGGDKFPIHLNLFVFLGKNDKKKPNK